MKLVHWLTSLALLTASFDVILALSIGGTVRFAQLMLLGIIVCGFARMFQTRTILWPRGGYALASWCFLQALLITQSLNPVVSLYPFFQLMFLVAGIFAVVQLYGRSDLIPQLMRVYLISFVFVAGWGAIQFMLPILHLGKPLIVQWIIGGIIPRINGFSFEPSYFATYLVMGWIMLVDLRVSKARMTFGRRWTYYLILVSAVLFFSTSKTAWLLMIVEGLARLLPRVFDLLRRQFKALRSGSTIIPVPRMRIVVLSIVFLVSGFVFLSAVSQFIDLNRFLAGTGLNGTAAHSLNDRLGGFAVTTELIEQHFWIGRSLGGVNEGMAALLGGRVETFADLHRYWGFPVPLDVIAASGFWCFIPFLWFFYRITGGESKLIRSHWNDERAKWLHALIRALIFEWLALLADQNLLRIYLWFHVTMVVVVGYNLRYSNAGELPAESLVPA
jgi:hypothetical protein